MKKLEEDSSCALQLCVSANLCSLDVAPLTSEYCMRSIRCYANVLELMLMPVVKLVLLLNETEET